jgi:hypothetical protein
MDISMSKKVSSSNQGVERRDERTQSDQAKAQLRKMKDDVAKL